MNSADTQGLVVCSYVRFLNHSQDQEADIQRRGPFHMLKRDNPKQRHRSLRFGCFPRGKHCSSFLASGGGRSDMEELTSSGQTGSVYHVNRVWSRIMSLSMLPMVGSSFSVLRSVPSATTPSASRRGLL
jgi:hypothetical protein